MRRPLPRFTDRLKLGTSGLSVSPFCVGRVRAAAVVEDAFERGINFFFLTADMHWPIYEPLRKGLRNLLRGHPGRRSKLVIGVVSYQTQPDFCFNPFREVLDSLPELKHIDLLIAGGVYATSWKDRLPVYVQHRAGHFLGANAVGASFHDRAIARHLIRRQAFDINFVRYNPAHNGARRDVFPHVRERRNSRLFAFNTSLGWLPPARLDALGVDGRTYWHPRVTDYYRFALSHPQVDGLLFAPRTTGDLARLESALEQGPLSRTEERYLLDLALVSQGRASVVRTKA